MKYIFPTIGVAECSSGRNCDKNDDEDKIDDFIFRYTAVIGTVTFGIECKNLRDPNSEFIKIVPSVTSKSRRGVRIKRTLSNLWSPYSELE